MTIFFQWELWKGCGALTELGAAMPEIPLPRYNNNQPVQLNAVQVAP